VMARFSAPVQTGCGLHPPHRNSLSCITALAEHFEAKISMRIQAVNLKIFVGTSELLYIYIYIYLFIYLYICKHTLNSEWPRGLRRVSTATRLLGLWVRIPPGASMSASRECCVLSGEGLCVGLITRPEESYRVWCVCM